MRRRDFIATALAATTLPMPVSAGNDPPFSKPERIFIGSLADTIVPGADAGETVRLLHGLLDEAAGARFQTGLRRLETKLTRRFSALSEKERNARLKNLLKKDLPEDAAFAFDVVRQVATIELFTRRAGQDLLAVPFRIAP